MPKQLVHVNKVRLWCSSLGVLTAVSISRHDAEMKLAAFVPLLMDRFTDACFTPASLEYVAAKCVKGFPTYGELAAYLAEWWKANRPPPSSDVLRLTAPPPPPPRRQPTLEEIEHVSRVTRETVAALRSSVQPVEERRPPGARPLSPGVLDQINPLPNGWSRANATTIATASPAAVDPDAAPELASANDDDRGDAFAGDDA